MHPVVSNQLTEVLAGVGDFKDFLKLVIITPPGDDVAGPKSGWGAFHVF